MKYQTILNLATNIIDDNELNINEKLYNICKLLSTNINHYNWVGFYFANHYTKTLHLGPYFGDETEHTVIPFGKGICGQVAVSNSNFVVPDVSEQSNYIACSLTVKAEIVVPIFVKNLNIGQIDIDSHTINPFTDEDVIFLEKLTKMISKIYESI